MSTKAKTFPKRDIYQEVTDKILKLLEEGTVPWRNPIKRSTQNDGIPRSLSTKKPYRGINFFLLAMTSLAKGYESGYWLTFKQAQKLNAKIRKGEKATLVTFWKQIEREGKNGKQESIPVLRHYNVFNCDQIEDFTPPDKVEEDLTNEEPFIPIDQAEEIVKTYPNPPKIIEEGSRAYYRPSSDIIHLPPPEKFREREERYATLFHEMAHSTGHSRRLNRKIGNGPSAFGSPDYSEEELVAELGSAFLCAHAGISSATIEQSAAYIDGWRKQLSKDKRLVIRAAGAGQRSADWILNMTNS